MFKLFDPLKKTKKEVEKINFLESEIQKLTDDELKSESIKLKEAATPETLDSQMPRAFALIREAAKRTLGQRHYDVQLIGGIALHQGNVTEMVTGEGKTLAATAPAYLNALVGGVHVVTVNDYLAKRDTVWMGQVYHALGLSVACIAHESAYIYDSSFKGAQEEDEERDELGSFKVAESYLRPISRKEAYQADIVYGTNHEFGFDYLRDNLAPAVENQVQRGHYFVIVDEVDSILIDEARTPLIISAPDTESSEFYKVFARIVAGLKKGVDYEVDEKLRSATATQEGIDKVEKQLKVNLYEPENLRLNHYFQEMLKAYGLFQRDKEYVVKEGQVVIVDQFTGRLMPGRRYSAGLHQAIEAKEGVKVQNESRTYAQISIQNYFRLYKKMAGMTGTAQTSSEEFEKVYGLEVVVVPTNKPLARKTLSDVIYKTKEAKMRAITKRVGELQKSGQPVLVGTASIDDNEEVSKQFNRAGVKHEILNAKNHEREGAIIAQAGRPGAVTVATNMAGRGVDIVLGGNPQNPEATRRVCDLGGLHVIGTIRHEARRIDNQLRGRAGRQGDPGSSQFYLSLEDDLLRVFGGGRIQKLMNSLKVPEDEPISAGLISKAVEQAQSKIEGMHFDARKHLLDYDDVLNKQRQAIYRKRQELLVSSSHPQILQVLDLLWMNHLENIEALTESVRIRAYGQRDPLIEFRQEAHSLYKQLLADFEQWVEENKERLEKQESSHPEPSPRHTAESRKIGRNDPCHCGATRSDGQPVKYKHCHGK